MTLPFDSVEGSEGAFMSGLPPRNSMFVDRNETLKELTKALNPETSEPASKPRDRRSCIIHGLGGLGKSQVALEYAHCFGHCYSHIFWIRAETEMVLTDSFVNILRRVGIEEEKIETDKKIELAREWLESTVNDWLLVFDNLEDAATVSSFWPGGTSGTILVTTQNATLIHLASVEIDLAPMKPAEGSALIHKYLQRGGSDKEGAERLSRELGGHPLAIAHYAGYLARSQSSLQLILESLRDRKYSSRIWADGSVASLSGYPQTLETVWDLALTRLSEDARKLLDMISFLNPEFIPEEMFLGHEPPPRQGKWQHWDEFRFNEAVGILRERHLIQVVRVEEGRRMTIHRVLQMRVLHELNKKLLQRQSAYESARDVLREAFPRPNIAARGDERTWPAMSKYLPHIMSLHAAVEVSDPKIDGDLEFVDILADASRFLFESGVHEEAVPFLDTAESICDDILPAKPMDTKVLYPAILSLISLYERFAGVQGRHMALAYIQKSVELQAEYMRDLSLNSVTDLDHINVGRFFLDQGCGLLQTDYITEADSSFTQALNSYAKAGDEKTLGVRFGSAYVFQSFICAVNSRRKEAVELSDRGYRIVREILGDDSHQSTFLNFLRALILFNTGELEASCSIFKDVLAVRRRGLGETNHETLSSQYCLAVTSQWLGDLEIAESDLRHILKFSKVGLQWRDEDLARAAFRLSLVLKQQQRFEEAASFERKAHQLRLEWDHMIPERVSTGLSGDRAEMARYDFCVYAWHGRTAGIWNTGHIW